MANSLSLDCKIKQTNLVFFRLVGCAGVTPHRISAMLIIHDSVGSFQTAQKSLGDFAPLLDVGSDQRLKGMNKHTLRKQLIRRW